MKITHVEVTTLNNLFVNDRIRRAMQRANTHGERLHVYRVETDNGLAGYGDSQDRRTDFSWMIGKSPVGLLTDPRLNVGLQIALYDVVGKAEGVPVYQLLGPKVRDWCPIAWWAIDMSPEEWAEEAKHAVGLGYASFKLKARPWWDIVEQVEAITQVVPSHFKLDVDFNSFLLNAGNAVPKLRQLDQYETVAIYESPIPQEDIEGYKHLRDRIAHPISLHFGSPPIMTTLREEVCDGFVIGGTAGMIAQQAGIAAAANKSFWLQMVGGGLMTAFTVHLGAVHTHARWPAITCHELWDDLLVERLDVKDGYIRVPEAPGLGVQVDDAAIERYRIDPEAPSPKEEYLRQRHVLRIRWKGTNGRPGRSWAFLTETDYQRSFYAGNMPLFVPGVRLEVIEDDKSAAFNHLYERVQQGIVRE
ncbi:MAG: enolase [Candidatus Latescibacteria bacterium]|nr:enolase [Candidatus Latescibacterota bacterium]